MNRRNFLIGLASLISLAAGNALGIVEKLFWLKPGSGINYKERALDKDLKIKRTCLSCHYFLDDKKNKDGGLCKHSQVVNKNKGQKVYVKKDGICVMFKKKVVAAAPVAPKKV